MVQTEDKSVDVKKGKELPLTEGAALKPQKFDRNESDDLMAWSKLRSQYLADANAASAQTVVVNNPGWWAGTGWYWNPWYSTWAFLPGSGFLYNPWGFGFYSPSYFYYNPPLYYGGVGRVWTGGVRGPRGGGAVGARPNPAPVGGSGVGFGAARPSAPRMAAPRMSRRGWLPPDGCSNGRRRRPVRWPAISISWRRPATGCRRRHDSVYRNTSTSAELYVRAIMERRTADGCRC